MADPRTVKRALARLAEGAPTTPAHDAAVIERAVAATRDVEAAAAFVDATGTDRLADAAAAAEAAGERDLARRGRRARAAFVRFRAAAGPDHFRPDHGTPLLDDSQSGDT